MDDAFSFQIGLIGVTWMPGIVNFGSRLCEADRHMKPSSCAVTKPIFHHTKAVGLKNSTHGSKIPSGFPSIWPWNFILGSVNIQRQSDVCKSFFHHVRFAIFFPSSTKAFFDNVFGGAKWRQKIPSTGIFSKIINLSTTRENLQHWDFFSKLSTPHHGAHTQRNF